MNTASTDTEASATSSQLHTSAGVGSPPRAAGSEYFDLFEVALFFKKWRLLIVMTMVAGLGAGSVVSFLLPSYYDSTVYFEVDQRQGNTILKEPEVNAALADMLLKKHIADAFATFFFDALSRSLDETGTKSSSKAPSTYATLINEFARYSDTYAEKSKRNEPLTLADAKKGFVSYAMNSMVYHLGHLDSIPSTGFLFLISSSKGRWRLLTRLSEHGLMDDVAYAVVDSLNRVINLHNDETYQIALARKQAQLTQQEDVLKTLASLAQSLHKLDVEKLKTKIDLLAIDHKLHKIAATNPLLNSYLNDGAVKPLIDTNLLAKGNDQFGNVVDVMIENGILKKTSALLDNHAIKPEQADAVVNDLVIHRRKKVELANSFERHSTLLDRSRTEYNATLLDIKVNLANQVPKLGNAEINHDDIAEARIVGKLEVKRSMLLKLLALGSALGFMLACCYALFSSGRRKSNYHPV